MSERPFTRPPAGSDDYYEDLNGDYDRRGNYNRNNNSVTFSERRGFVISVMLALSILVNLAGCWLVYTYKTEKRLQEYDLDWFKSSDFAQLKGEVAAHDKMILMLQIHKECLNKS